MPRHAQLLPLALLLCAAVCLKLPSHDGPDVTVIYPPDLEAEAAAKLAKVPKNPDRARVNEVVPMAEPLEEYPEGTEPLRARPDQMRDTAAPDCPDCGYKAPFLEHNGGAAVEKEKVMNEVLDKARRSEHGPSIMQAVTFEPDGKVPPAHAFTMSRSELVAALERLDPLSSDAQIASMDTETMKKRVAQLLTGPDSPSTTPSVTASSSVSVTPSITASPVSPSSSASTSLSSSAEPSPSSLASETPSISFSPSTSESPSASPTPSESATKSPPASTEEPIVSPGVIGQNQNQNIGQSSLKTSPTPSPSVSEEEPGCDQLGTRLAIALVVMHSVVSVVMFVVNQVNPLNEADGFSSKLPEFLYSCGEIADKFFNQEKLAAASTGLQMLPAAATLMLYVTLRACVHGVYADNNSDYRNLQIGGFATYTAGTALLTLDALGVSVTGVCGNLNQSIGSLSTIIGYFYLIWGAVNLRDDEINKSLAEDCMIAMSVFVLIFVTVLMSVRFIKPLLNTSTSAGKGLALITDLANEEKLQEVISTCSFAPLMMLLFLYVDLHHLDEDVEPVTGSVKTSMVAGVGATYLLGLLTLLRASNAMNISRLTLVVRVMILLCIYAAILMIVYVYLCQGASSLAGTCLLIVAFAVAAIKAALLFKQDATNTYLDDVGVEDRLPSPGRIGNEDKQADLLSVLKKMMGAASMASVMAILFAYLHFQPVIYLEVDPEAYLERHAWVPNGIMLATASIFIQMIATVLGAVLGERPVFDLLGYIGLFLFQIGLIMCCTAALES